LLISIPFFRYTGLTEAQLLTSFELLAQEDNPDTEYDAWTRGIEIPDAFKSLSGVNTQDMEQFRKHVFPVFAANISAIDFFLSRIVFPKGAREYTLKLASSAWDLAGIKARVTTGFSGTNDRSRLLPSTIEQHDPVQQGSTNALTLNYLLRPENDHYKVRPADPILSLSLGSWFVDHGR
jgi:hypothetical protein